MRTVKYLLILFASLTALVIIARSFNDSPADKKEDEDFKRKYIFAKVLDETAYKDMGGIFHKVEMGTTKRLEITLDMRDRMAYGVAKKLGPEVKKNGFEVLRIKDKSSDRYEDINL